ncbi:putative aldolase class 2 protein PA3430 [Diadema setosum]|uniref:putative aldolase class 2 protein PA3430 n=1 Tax=Diadema setosum TaxID=31175 RepID=UPI003B3B674E
MAASTVKSIASLLFRGACSKGFTGRHSRAAPTLLQRWLSTATSTKQNSSPLDQACRQKANYEARVELAAAYRAVDLHGLGEGVCNHLTMRAPARDREGDVMLVVPYGLQWRQVTASSLVGVDFETGEKVEGEGVALQTAVCIHVPIHRMRYEMDGTTAVMHTHQPYVLALACLDEPAPFDETMCQNSMRFAGKIAYDWVYETLAYAMDEGERLGKALGDKDVLIMGQHGVLTVGRRVCDAFDALYYLERAAKVQILARSAGAKTRSAPPSVVKFVSEHDCYPYNAINHFESIKKLIANQEPNFRE